MIEIRDWLIKYLKGTGWEVELYHYLYSEEFMQILEKLKSLTDDNKRYVPGIKIALQWMKVCPFDSIKAVMLIDEWYAYLNKQGVPYSQDNEKMRRNEFKPDIKICNRKEITELIDPLMPYYKMFDYNLERWCKQGVLMFPIAPTCRLDGKPHYKIWSGFVNRVIEAINIAHKDVPWMLLERGCWKYEDQIESKNTILYTSYPKCSNENWYKDINKVLTDRNIESIKW